VQRRPNGMHSARRTRRAAGPAALVLLVASAGIVTALRLGDGVAAHGAATASPPARAMVAVVIAGQYCPVAQAEHPCPARPIRAVQVAVLRHGDVVALGRTDSRGAVDLSAAPGPAVIHAISDSGGYVSRTSQLVTLDAASPTHVRLLLDTGLR
jgi:hypothetical protein